MTDPAAKVQDLANAYRAAMRAGDQELQGDRVQRLILQAIVFDSASRAEVWVNTRVHDGAAIAKPLTVLTPELNKGNLVGRSLQQARDEAVKQAKSAVTSVATTGALPAGIASVVTFILGVFAFSQEAGAAFGAVAIPALLGGGAIVGAVMRALAAAPQLAQAAGDVAGSSLDSADAIGSSADAVFRRHAGPALASFAELGYQAPAVSPVLSQLRGGAKGILLTVYGILALCAIFFLFGIGDAYTAYQQEKAACPVQLPDGTCIGG